jgi:hypothetical protein
VRDVAERAETQARRGFACGEASTSLVLWQRSLHRSVNSISPVAARIVG